MTAPQLVLLLVALVSCATGQQCSSYDCSTCLSNPACYYYVSCGYCTSYSGGICDGQPPTNNPGSCPVIPTAAEAALPLSSAYWALALAFVAVGATAVLSYAPLEKLCGQRASSSHHSGFGCSHHLLFVSCCCLWLGFSLSLAAPVLPWLVSPSVRGADAATAFYFITCQRDTRAGSASFCNQIPMVQYLNYGQSFGGSGAPSASDLAYAQNGLALGVIAYVFTIGLMFPCALMASIAVYRLNRLVKNGISPYSSGCSPASLSVAQMLGWPSFAVFSIAFFCALSLSSAAADKLNSFRSGGPQVVYSAMPGSVAAGVSFAFQLVGLVLLSVAARALASVQGVGCNGGGCCRLATENGPVPDKFMASAEGTSLLSRA